MAVQTVEAGSIGVGGEGSGCVVLLSMPGSREMTRRLDGGSGALYEIRWCRRAIHGAA